MCEVPGEGPGECFEDGDWLFCLPDGAGGPGPDDLPPEAFAECLGLSIEDPCVATTLDGGAPGLCLPAPEDLACIPESWLEGGPGGPGGGDDPYAAAPFWDRDPAWFDCDVGF